MKTISLRGWLSKPFAQTKPQMETPSGPCPTAKEVTSDATNPVRRLLFAATIMGSSRPHAGDDGDGGA